MGLSAGEVQISLDMNSARNLTTTFAIKVSGNADSHNILRLFYFFILTWSQGVRMLSSSPLAYPTFVAYIECDIFQF